MITHTAFTVVSQRREPKHGQRAGPGGLCYGPPGHRGTSDLWFSHPVAEASGDETCNERWMEAVSDEDYGKLS